MPPSKNTSDIDYHQLASQIKRWGIELGFQQIGIADTQLQFHAEKLQHWLERGYHGSMEWMDARKAQRSSPETLLPGTLRVITARMDYLTTTTEPINILQDPNKAYVSRYALGRDYHKLIRKRLKQLADKIQSELSDQLQQRPFVDSAPVLERALAEKANLGWIGKNTMLINSKAGSWFFLGELFTDLPLPVEPESTSFHCGSCTACLDICPTKAFVNAFELDARKCISYLTIEHKGSIPEYLRPLMGNRIYGCDDCQLVCPWNKFAKSTQETDFLPRYSLDDTSLVALFKWTEEEFLQKTEGSPIRRIGYENWLRNISIALGNAPTSENTTHCLTEKIDHPSSVVKEHVRWALKQHGC